jgi:hypothetical protein
MSTPTKIFESPDRGRTVYERLPGTSRRDLVREYDPRTWDGRPLHEHIMEDKMWAQIRIMARTDAGLQEILERAIVYYNLRRDHDR